jgi:DNA-binding NtrC family response regulator
MGGSACEGVGNQRRNGARVNVEAERKVGSSVNESGAENGRDSDAVVIPLHAPMATPSNGASACGAWDELTPARLAPVPARAAQPDGQLLRMAYSPRDGGPSALRLERELVIGRANREQTSEGGGPGLRLNDGLVSRAHARIERLAGKSYWIADLRSRNGTFVNGHRVAQARLEPGDVIRCGDSLLIFGEEDRMSAVRADADKLALTDLPLLIEGETGAGKAVLAKRIHSMSGRNGRFVEINSAQLTGALDGSTLFGHVRGAFTGADRDRTGLIAQAEGGTLFLDEFAELPLETQVKILQAVERGLFRPVGGNREISANVRFIGATNADLAQEVVRGRLRFDLVRRFAQPVLRIPPLRERRGGLVALLRELASELRFELFDRLSVGALERLMLLPFPGNVRDVQHLLVRLASFGQSAFDTFFEHQTKEILEAHRRQLLERPSTTLLEPGQQATHPTSSPSSGAVGVNRALLERILEEEEGCVVRAAERVGITPRHLYRVAYRQGLKPEDLRRFRER